MLAKNLLNFRNPLKIFTSTHLWRLKSVRKIIPHGKIPNDISLCTFMYLE